MPIDLEQHRQAHAEVLAWPSVSHASAQLCRPQLRLVEPATEIQLETQTTFSVAAISVDGDDIAIDGLLESTVAGTILDINGIPVRVHPSGTFSAVVPQPERRSLTITMTIALDTTPAAEDRSSEQA